jgi:hypothetical protein
MNFTEQEVDFAFNKLGIHWIVRAIDKFILDCLGCTLLHGFIKKIK